jgi:hypothetical protein
MLTVIAGPHLDKSFQFTERDNFLVGLSPAAPPEALLSFGR